jgi:hypothetical protein
MGLSRNALRNEAKKLYKEQIKGVPKKQRVPFSVFFKKYKKLKNEDSGEKPEVVQNIEEEDFDIENIINVNEISDDDVELPQTIVREEDF